MVIPCQSIQSNVVETQPVIGFWAFPPSGILLDYTAAVSMPSYVPHHPSGLPDKMTFLQRAKNLALKAGWWLMTRYSTYWIIWQFCGYPNGPSHSENHLLIWQSVCMTSSLIPSSVILSDRHCIVFYGTEDIGYYDYRPVTLLFACFISFQLYALS